MYQKNVKICPENPNLSTDFAPGPQPCSSIALFALWTLAEQNPGSANTIAYGHNCWKMANG